MSSQSPKGPGAFLLLQKTLAEARRRLAEGAFDTALERTEPLLKRFPEHVELRLIHAEALGRAGDTAGARDMLDGLLSERPSLTRAKKLRASFADPSTEDLAIHSDSEDVVTQDQGAITNEVSEHVPVLGSMSFDEDDDTMIAMSERDRAVSPMGWDDGDDTTGSFDGLSSDVLERAREVAVEMGLTPEDDADEMEQLDSDILMLADDEEDVETRVRDRPDFSGLLAPNSPARLASEETVRARPDASQVSGEEKKPRRVKRFQRAVSSSPFDVTGHGEQGAVIEPPQAVIGTDAQVDEEDPTINLTDMNAKIELARQYALRQQQGAAAGPRSRRGPSPTVTVQPGPGTMTQVFGRLDRGRLRRVAMISGGVFLTLFGLFWLPWAWEEHLLAEIDARMVEARALCRESTASGCDRALSELKDIDGLSGARIDALGSLLSWYVEDLFGDDELVEARHDAHALEGRLRGYIATHFDASQVKTLGKAVKGEEASNSPEWMIARAWWFHLVGKSEEGVKLVRRLDRLGVIYPPLEVVRAQLEEDQGDVDSSRTRLETSIALWGDPASRLALARSLELDDPERSRALYREVDRGGSHPMATLGLLRLEQQGGRDVSTELERIVDGSREGFSPVEQADALRLLADWAAQRGWEQERLKYLVAAGELDPWDMELRLEQVTHQLRLGHRDAAEAVVKSITELAPEHPLVRSSQAELLIATGFVQAGLSLLKGLRERHGYPAYRLGRRALLARDYEVAQRYFAEAGEKLPPGVERRLAVGLSEGLSSSSALLELRSRVTRTRLRRDEQLLVAWALMSREEEWAGAVQLLDSLVERNREDALARSGLCLSMALLGRSGAREHCLEASTAGLEGRGVIALTLGYAELELGQYEVATRNFEQALEEHEGVAQLEGALLAAFERDDAIRARAYLERWPESEAMRPVRRYWKGRLALLEGEPTRAAVHFGAIIGARGAPSLWRLAHVEALLADGRIREARKTLEGLELEPSLEAKADVLRAKLERVDGRLEKAEELANNAKRRFVRREDRRGQAMAWVELALIERARDKPDAARDALDKALEAMPFYVEARLEKARLMFSSDTRRARAQLEQILKRVPEQREALSLKERL